jgi:hypothetical protein
VLGKRQVMSGLDTVYSNVDQLLLGNPVLDYELGYPNLGLAGDNGVVDRIVEVAVLNQSAVFLTSFE